VVEAFPHDFVLAGDGRPIEDVVRTAIAPRYTVAPDGLPRRLRLTWLDTFDWRLYHAGLTLRHNVGSRVSDYTLTGDDGEQITADVVGPICESSDFFLRDAPVARAEEGDLLAIRDVGAYGFAMSSNYNFRGRPAEVWVEKGAFRVVRRREDFDDLVRGERE
jgi:hypothetical protein